MIVVGSMIGSAIFIVSGDISHQVQSPGLLLVVWIVAGVMTIICALSYGELAAMMPHAGGQYVFLRDSLGPIWGFLYGWTMLLVIQTATIAAVAIAFAKFTAVLVPFFSASDWIWKIGTFGPWQLWFGSLGPYNVGLNRQNLSGHRFDRASHVGEHARPSRGQDRAECFHRREDRRSCGAGPAGRVLFDSGCSRRELHEFLAQRLARHRASLSARSTHVAHRHDYAGGRGHGGLSFRRGRVEQRHLHGRRGEESEPQSAAVAGSRNGPRHSALHAGERRLPACSADVGRPERRDGHWRAESNSPRTGASPRPPRKW